MTVICRFTHDTSLVVGYRNGGFGIVGKQPGVYHRFDMPDGQIVAAVNLSDGLVHLVMSTGAVYAVSSNPETEFIVVKLS